MKRMLLAQLNAQSGTHDWEGSISQSFGGLVLGATEAVFSQGNIAK